MGSVVEASTRRWYEEYYSKKGADRNDLWANRGVLFQTLASERGIVQAHYRVRLDPHTATVLDVGCGSGADMYQLFRLGYRPENVTGIDILPERIAVASGLYSHVRWVLGDASRMEFADGSFNVLFESTMFATIADDELSCRIAAEMVRVCKPGGYLVLQDWRWWRPGDSRYRALHRRRVARLFAVGQRTTLLSVHPGADPAGGSVLVHVASSAYFLVTALAPWLVGQVIYVLRKK